MSERKSLYGKPMPDTLPGAHRRILELEHALSSAVRLARDYAKALGKDGTPKVRERLAACQEILQQESLEHE